MAERVKHKSYSGRRIRFIFIVVFVVEMIYTIKDSPDTYNLDPLIKKGYKNVMEHV